MAPTIGHPSSPSLLPIHRDQLRSSVDEGSATNVERAAHLTSPTDQVHDISSGFLHVPTQTRHFRSHSSSSNGSHLSTWTICPSPTTASSDIGDPYIDIRRLLDIDDNEESCVDNPFAFTAEQLVKLHDPKDLNLLRAMGGLEGLCLGLRIDSHEGLSPEEDIVDGRVTLEDVRHTLEMHQRGLFSRTLANGNPDQREDGHVNSRICSAQDEHSAENRILSLKSRRSTMSSINSQRSPKLFRDRRRVFGENRIPARKPKNIFQLMWLALHDKVLVFSPFSPFLILDSIMLGCRDLACPWALSDVSTWLQE